MAEAIAELAEADPEFEAEIHATDDPDEPERQDHQRSPL